MPTEITVAEGRRHSPAREEPPPRPNPALIYLSRLSPGSRRTMRGSLRRIVEILTYGEGAFADFPWDRLEYQHTAAVRAALTQQYAPATANKMLAALRGVLQEAWRLGFMPAEQYHRAVDLPRVKVSTLPRGRALAAGELRSLFRACSRDEGPIGRRDAATFAILYGAGLRRAEAVALDLADYDPDDGSITVREGKGRKDRIAYLEPSGCAAVEAWIRFRGDEDGPLLWPFRKGGKPEPRRMTAAAIYGRLRTRAEEAGVERFSPHDLRRTFISDLLDAGADLSAVQQLAGHANMQTTARYDRRGESAKRAAAALLRVPYAAPAGAGAADAPTAAAASWTGSTAVPSRSWS